MRNLKGSTQTVTVTEGHRSITRAMLQQAIEAVSSEFTDRLSDVISSEGSGCKYIGSAL
jgi:hypothetical protein